MGGDGTIGGGKSCKVRFFVYDELPGGIKAQKEYWRCDDDDVGDYPFNITITYPDGNKVDVPITGPQDHVRISWKHARQRKPKAGGAKGMPGGAKARGGGAKAKAR